MELSIKSNSKEEREIIIIKACQTMGKELKGLVKNSKNINPEIKDKITTEICYQYATETIGGFLSPFVYAEVIELNFNEYNAMQLAAIIADLNDEDYSKIKQHSESLMKKSEERLEQLTKGTNGSSQPGDSE